jgi:hypothetical protein
MLDFLTDPVAIIVEKVEEQRQIALQCQAFLSLLDELHSGNQGSVTDQNDPMPTDYLTYERSHRD